MPALYRKFYSNAVQQNFYLTVHTSPKRKIKFTRSKPLISLAPNLRYFTAF